MSYRSPRVLAELGLVVLTRFRARLWQATNRSRLRLRRHGRSSAATRCRSSSSLGQQLDDSTATIAVGMSLDCTLTIGSRRNYGSDTSLAVPGYDRPQVPCAGNIIRKEGIFSRQVSASEMPLINADVLPLKNLLYI